MNINATIFGQTIAFVLFVFFCMKYVWPPLISIIEKRQKEITDGLIFAELAKKDLDIARIKAEDHLKKAKNQALTIIDQANKRKTQLIDEAKAQALLERDKILSQAKLEISVERNRAREELRNYVAMLVLAGTEKLIGRYIEVTNIDIIDKIIDEL